MYLKSTLVNPFFGLGPKPKTNLKIVVTFGPITTVQCTMEVDTSSATTWRVVNIIKEECIKVGNPVEEALICCVLKMIYDNPKNGFDSDLPMDRHAVRRLIGE